MVLLPTQKSSQGSRTPKIAKLGWGPGTGVPGIEIRKGSRTPNQQNLRQS